MRIALSERIMVRVSPQTKAVLERCAEKEHRQVSEYVRLLIEREIAVPCKDAQPEPEKRASAVASGDCRAD